MEKMESAPQDKNKMKELAHILLVDDNPSMRDTLTDLLESAGYQVTGAGSVEEGLARLKEKGFNLVLSDIVLPDGSGLDLLKTIRADYPDIVVIMMTAFASLDSSIQAMNEGAYSYFVKPYRFEEVKIVLEKALEKQRLAFENKKLTEDLIKANQELVEVNEKLKKMDELKSAFVANVSHEFRSPLSVFKSWIDILMDEVTGPLNEKQKEALTIILNNVNRLSRLVNDLLDLAKIESGKMELNRELVEIGALVREILATYEVKFKERKFIVESKIEETLSPLWGDRDRLTQVFINLMNNAVKFTPVGGRIAIVLSDEVEGCRVEVADTGPGIPKEEQGKIFDKFERLFAEREEGTGLGLAIVKDIIQLHKGRIWIESEVGKGSKFIFILPRDLRRNR